MAFPEKHHGRCPVCGGWAKDMDDAPDGWVSRPTDSSDGYDLHLYRGERMCQLCIKRAKADEGSLEAEEFRRDEAEFRARTGFRTTMES